MNTLRFVILPCRGGGSSASVLCGVLRNARGRRWHTVAAMPRHRRRRPLRPRRPRRRRRRRPPQRRRRPTARSASHDLRPDRPGASPAAAGQFAAGASTSHALLREAGRLPGRRGETYLYYIQLKAQPAVRRPTVGVRTTTTSSRSILARLQAAVGDQLPRRPRRSKSATSAFSNGVIGKVVVYNMEERQRVKIVDYVGTRRRSTSRRSKKSSRRSELRSGSTRSSIPACIRRVSGRRARRLRREGLRVRRGQAGDQGDRGRAEARERHLPHHRRAEGQDPRGRLRRQQARSSDGKLRAQDEGEQGRRHASRSSSSGGTYKEDKFEEDADNVVDYYRDRGYIERAVGQPELKILEDSKDSKTRWVQLRIPVTEGQALPGSADFNFEGNTVAKAEALRPLFKVEEGETYSEKKIRKGFEKVQEVYGSGGYYEFTAYPDLSPRDEPAMTPNGAAGPPAPAPADGDGSSGDGKTAEGKTADGKTADGKTADGKTADGKAADGKAADGEEPEESQDADGKTADGKTADGKTADGNDAKNGDKDNEKKDPARSST